MSIETVMNRINKRYGRGTIVRASDALGLTIKRFSTGSHSLDIALGGGFVEGRINEVIGHYSAYKSTLAICGATKFIKKEPKKRYVVYIDVENAFDVKWLKFLDADPNKFLLVSPTTSEQSVDIVCDVLDEGDQVLVIFDSIGAITPHFEVEKKMEKSSVGMHPRFVSKMLRKLIPRLKKDLLSSTPKSTILLLNQVRVQIGVMFGDPETAPGGKALEHAASVCVKLYRKGYIYEEIKESGETLKQAVGTTVGFVVVKNKTGGNANERGFFNFYNRAYGYREGGTIDNALDLLPMAVVYGIVRKKGHAYSYQGIKANGREKFCKKIYMDKYVLQDLYNDVMKVHKGKLQLKRTGDKAKKRQKKNRKAFAL